MYSGYCFFVSRRKEPTFLQLAWDQWESQDSIEVLTINVAYMDYMGDIDYNEYGNKEGF